MPLPSKIGTLSPAEVGTLIDWAAGEGWNPGLQDAAAFRAADPDGFLGVFTDGQLAAGISAVAYGADFGFIGLYICRPDMRGRGHGKAVWDAGMARLAGRTIGLDGVPEQQANYRSMGFVPAYRTFRLSGRAVIAADMPGSVSPITADLLPGVAAFDRLFFPAPRPAFLQAWLASPHFALTAIDGDAVRGYGVARACREGFKIGPLFARDQTTATALFAALSEACDGDIHIDVPETNRGFTDFLLAGGMSKGFETMRMYVGAAPQTEQAGIFGVTSLELG